MFANTTLDMQLSTQNHLNAFGFWRCNYFVRFFRPGPVQKTSSLNKSHLKKICSWSFADPATCIYHPFPSSLHLSKFKTYFFNTFHCSHIKHPRRPESITSNISLRALSGTWRQRPGRPRRPPLAAPWRRARRAGPGGWNEAAGEAMGKAASHGIHLAGMTRRLANWRWIVGVEDEWKESCFWVSKNWTSW